MRPIAIRSASDVAPVACLVGRERKLFARSTAGSPVRRRGARPTARHVAAAGPRGRPGGEPVSDHGQSLRVLGDAEHVLRARSRRSQARFRPVDLSGADRRQRLRRQRDLYRHRAHRLCERAANDFSSQAYGVELQNSPAARVAANRFDFPSGVAGCEIRVLGLGERIDFSRVVPGAGMCMPQGAG